MKASIYKGRGCSKKQYYIAKVNLYRRTTTDVFWAIVIQSPKNQMFGVQRFDSFESAQNRLDITCDQREYRWCGESKEVPEFELDGENRDDMNRLRGRF